MYRIYYDTEYKPTISKKLVYSNHISFSNALILDDQRDYQGITLKDSNNEYFKVSMKKNQKLILSTSETKDNKKRVFKLYNKGKYLFKTYTIKYNDNEENFTNYTSKEYKSKSNQIIYIEVLSNTTGYYSIALY